MDTRTERALRYQRVLLAQGVDLDHDPDSLVAQCTAVVVNGEDIAEILARVPPGGDVPDSVPVDIAEAVARFDRQFAPLRKAAPEFTARDLVMPTVTDALAHLFRPKPVGNRAERRAAKRR